ncbi:MAG: hypothetical protein AAFX02_00575 [Pseudomonadota bacterium]
MSLPHPSPHDSAFARGRPFDLQGLIDFISLNGLRVSVHERIRLAKLAEWLDDSDVSFRSAEDAARWFVPILSSDRSTAELVRSLIEDWWEELPPANVAERAVEAMREKSKDEVVRNWILRAGLVVAVLAIVVAAVTLLGDSGEVTTAVNENCTNDCENKAPEVEQELAQFVLTYVFPRLAIVGFFAGVIYVLLFLRLGQKAVERSKGARGKEIDEPLQPRRSTLFLGEASQAAFHRMSQPDIVTSRHVNVSKSIQSFIRKPGEARITFRDRQRSREYVIFVEASSGEDHIHLLADAFVTEARRRDVQISRYEIRNRLSYLRFIDGSRDEGQSDRLGKIAQRHAGARLFVLGSGERLLDQLDKPRTRTEGAKSSGQSGRMFDDFDEPCLLSTTPPWAWGHREAELQEAGVTVLPLTEDGVAHAAALMVADEEERALIVFPKVESNRHPLLDWAARSRLEMLSDIPMSDSQTERLLDLLEDYFQPSGDWPVFLGLLLFPTITRAFTISFLHALEDQNQHVPVLPQGYSRLATITRFARLPWFQAARAPDWLILAAIERSSPDQVAHLRLILQHLFEFEDVLPKRKPGTTTPHPGLEADDWILRMFETGSDGKLDPMRRESLLVRLMRGDELSDLTQPIGTARSTPPMKRIVYAILAGLCAMILVNTGLPDFIRDTFASIVSAFGEIEPQVALLGFIPLNILLSFTLLAYPLIIWFDGFCPREQRRLGWLSRFLRPSTALMTGTNGPTRLIDRVYIWRRAKKSSSSSGSISDLNAQSEIRQDWNRVRTITQVASWITEAGFLIAVFLIFSLAWSDTPSNWDERLYFALIFVSGLGLRLYRWTGGWHAPPPQVRYPRLEEAAILDRISYHLHYSNPLTLGAGILPVLVICHFAYGFDQAGESLNYRIPFWVMWSGITAALLSMLRTKVSTPEGVWPNLRCLLGDFAVSLPIASVMSAIFVAFPLGEGGWMAVVVMFVFVGNLESMSTRIIILATIGLLFVDAFFLGMTVIFLTGPLWINPELVFLKLSGLVFVLSILAWALGQLWWRNSPEDRPPLLPIFRSDLFEIAAGPWFWAWLAILTPQVFAHFDLPANGLIVTGFCAALLPLIWKDRAILPNLVVIGFSVLGLLPHHGWGIAINFAALLSTVMLLRFGLAPTLYLRRIAHARISFMDSLVFGGLLLVGVKVQLTGFEISYDFSPTLTYGFLVIAILALRKQFPLLAVFLLLSYAATIFGLTDFELGIHVSLKEIVNLFPFVAAASLSVLLFRAGRNVAYLGLGILLAAIYLSELYGFGVRNPLDRMDAILNSTLQRADSELFGGTIPANWSGFSGVSQLRPLIFSWPALLAALLIKHHKASPGIVFMFTFLPIAVSYNLTELGDTGRDMPNALAIWAFCSYVALALAYFVASPAAQLLSPRRPSSIWFAGSLLAVIGTSTLMFPSDLFFLEAQDLTADRIEALRIDAFWTVPIFATTLILMAAMLEIREHPLLIAPKWYLSQLSRIWQRWQPTIVTMSNRFHQLQKWIETAPQSEDVNLVDAIWGPNAQRIILGVIAFFLAYFCYGIWEIATN